MTTRKTGTLVLLGMLCGAISGCGTQLDPRLQSNASLRESCTKNGSTYSDDKIRGILAAIEQRRLAGSTKQEANDAEESDCIQQGLKNDELSQCFGCHNACIDQIFRSF